MIISVIPRAGWLLDYCPRLLVPQCWLCPPVWRPGINTCTYSYWLRKYPQNDPTRAGRLWTWVDNNNQHKQTAEIQIFITLGWLPLPWVLAVGGPRWSRLGPGKGKMTNFNYKRVSKSQQEGCAAQIFLRNWTSSSVFGLIDIRFYFLAPNTLSDILIIFWLVRAFCHFTAKIYENWTPFQFKSELFMGRHVNFGVQSKPTNLTLNFLFRNRQISTKLAFVIYKLVRLTVPWPCVCRCLLISSTLSSLLQL